jgi:opacity protein-like surface antigen
MKKFAMAALAALSLGTVSAESCASSFSGFYAGVQAGMNSTTGTLTESNYYSNVLDTAGNDRKVNAGKKSFLGGIFAGYGMGVGSCAYVGAEVYGNFGNTSSTLYDASSEDASIKYFTVTMKRNYSLGAKVRLGYTVSQQAMIFVGLGLEYAKTQLKSENIQKTQAQTNCETAVKKNKGIISFAPSIGMDMFLNKNLFVRGEYTYVMGIKQKVDAKHVAAATTTATMKLNATQQRFALGLGYKF